MLHLQLHTVSIITILIKASGKVSNGDKFEEVHNM